MEKMEGDLGKDLDARTSSRKPYEEAELIHIIRDVSYALFIFFPAFASSSNL